MNQYPKYEKVEHPYPIYEHPYLYGDKQEAAKDWPIMIMAEPHIQKGCFLLHF